MKHKGNIIWSILSLVLAVSTINGQLDHGKVAVRDSIMVDSVWRIFDYHVPQFPSNNPSLVFVFHDNGMDAKAIQEITGFEFNALADKTAGTVIVYPQGHKNFWNHNQENIDDLDFIKSIVQRMERRYHIDRKNVFAVGYFNGGDMCYRLARVAPDIFKGFAVVGANMYANPDDDPALVNKPISIMIINDLADAQNPDSEAESVSLNGAVKQNGKSINNTLDYWVNLLGSNSRNPEPTCTFIEKSNSQAIRYDYCSAQRNHRVSFLKIIKGGYSFPNPNAKKWPQIGDEINRQINIPETILQFFYQLQYQDIAHLSK